ncbi:MAG: type I-B CRISPR-associated protein Cas5b [Fermentimonas sp.]|nr:type I-B CRISPR-associated protein Cas5b [Fermentimonas sp.]
MEKLISIDLKSDFGFFRKPDTNSTINLSYNIIHKPAILGIFGAIIGLEGYKEKGKTPEYYEVLKEIKLGVQPLEDEKGNYQKINIKYSNTVGYANKGSNFLTEEITLVNPQYRIFILLDLDNIHHNKLSNYLQNAQSEFIPYFGKNEFTAWWEKASYREYDFEQKIEINDSILIKTVFQKDFVVRENIDLPEPDIFSGKIIDLPYMYFERLPKGFDIDLMQYDLSEFVYSTYLIKNGGNLKNLYYLKEYDCYVQLF